MGIHVRHVLCFQSEDEDAVAKQVKSNTQQNEQANDDEEQAEVCMHRSEVSSIKKSIILSFETLSDVHSYRCFRAFHLPSLCLFIIFFIKSKVSPNLQSLFYQFGLFCQLELHILQ